MNDPIWDFNMRVGDCAYFHAAEFDVHVRIIGITTNGDDKAYLIWGARDQMEAAGYDDTYAPERSTDLWMINIAYPDELTIASPIKPTLIGSNT